jgi:hypothetical protein
MLFCYVLSFGKISEVDVMLVLEKIVILVLSNDSILFFAMLLAECVVGMVSRYGVWSWELFALFCLIYFCMSLQFCMFIWLCFVWCFVMF